MNPLRNSNMHSGGKGVIGASCIEIRQCKYLNNIVEQDHRNIKRRIRGMLGFKSFWKARIVLGGVELVNMIKKGQMKGASTLSDADKFYSLAA